MKPLPLLLAALAANTLSAQCLFTNVSTSAVGASCNVPSSGLCLIAVPPVSLSPLLDTPTCTLSIEVNAFEGCGAVVPLRVLALGFQTISLPVPELGAGCTLHVAPDVVLVTGSGPFALPLPHNVASLGFFAQGAVISVPPFGTGFFALSGGLGIGLQ